MNGLDVAVVALVVAAGVGGWRAGFVARMGAWLGLGIGLLLGLASLGPLLDLLGATPNDAFVVALGVLGFAALGGEVLGGAAGSQLSVHVPDDMRQVDRGAGAGAGALRVVVFLWLLAPLMASTPGWPERLADGSAVIAWSEATLPEAPDAVAAVEVLLGVDRYPAVFERNVGAPDVGPPPGTVSLAPGVDARIAQATVRVAGEACGRTQQGSGVVVAEGVVVTNAHVVSGVGAGSLVVEQTGRAMDATVVAWDPDADLAVLAVPGIVGGGLELTEPEDGELVVAAGYPGGGPLTVVPGRIGEVVRAGGRDIYDQHRVVRDVLVLAASIEQGNSGGPVVRPDGALVGVVFALAPDRADVGYALGTDAVRDILDEAGSSAVFTGACISG